MAKGHITDLLLLVATNGFIRSTPHLIHGSLQPRGTPPPNSTSIGSPVFAQLTRVPKLPNCHALWLQMDSSNLDPPFNTVSWAHTSQPTKWQIDRFSHFCTYICAINTYTDIQIMCTKASPISKIGWGPKIKKSCNSDMPSLHELFLTQIRNSHLTHSRDQKGNAKCT